MKLVRKESRPISADTGLMDIRDKVLSGELPEKAAELGKVYDVNCMPEYVEHLLTYIDTSALKPLKIVVNAGNGAAGPVIDAIQDKLPFEFIKVNHEPDGTFPNGVPNPLLEENRDATASVVLREKADLGVAWDGDFDRCFLFDENGVLVEGYYMVGLLAQAFLAQNKGAKIIYDPRLIWNTIELVEAAGGTPVMCKSGHAFIKERMRNVEAVYGGEMSAHHYFKDFSYCDSGMIPWLLVVELLAKTGKTLGQLVQSMTDNYPISGEINSTVADSKAVLAKIEETYAPNALSVDKTDGLSIAYENWRFNVRSSNTEPLLRLNVEARGDKALLDEKTQELVNLIRG
ncbi:MAG: phosphomannomutase, partial [Selenomonadales bacterium]|jgi:phosphomannomutase|nr:phosphomannomutase [Selenomonadales bacterium]